MKWATFNHPWRKRFAFLPVGVSNGPSTEYVWLEWYWRRFCGDCYEVSFIDPTADKDAALNQRGGGDHG